jgi:hypothetical protein
VPRSRKRVSTYPLPDTPSCASLVKYRDKFTFFYNTLKGLVLDYYRLTSLSRRTVINFSTEKYAISIYKAKSLQTKKFTKGIRSVLLGFTCFTLYNTQTCLFLCAVPHKMCCINPHHVLMTNPDVRYNIYIYICIYIYMADFGCLDE